MGRVILILFWLNICYNITKLQVIISFSIKEELVLNKIKYYSIIMVLVALFILTTGCATNFITPPPTTPTELSKGIITIAGGEDTTMDCTPILNISCEGAAFMSFSGDGENWTGWITYSSSYDGFNIANKFYGTIFGSGTKIVYVKFKNEEGITSPLDDFAYGTVFYNMPELVYFETSPRTTTMKITGESFFTAVGWSEGKEYEVPIDGDKVTWTHCCNVGKVDPTQGLSTTYTADGITSPCIKNITAYYEGKQTNAIINIIK